ncbi:MAG TPA: histidinol-phosphatase [Jatrophihabitans sp.]|nr:histidinol-phosphatase [Jatrophihabitans sp.]
MTDQQSPNPSTHAGLLEDLAVAQQLADLADRLTMDRFRAADLAVSSKPDLSLVSDADQAVEQAIRNHLAVRRPSDAFLGEESGTSGDSPRQWVIDPIDGTHSYVRGVPVWASLIALLVDGEPVLGVVSAPALGHRWWAARGHGAWAIELGSTDASAPAAPRRLRVSQVRALADASLSYSSLTHWAAIGRQQQFLQLLDAVWRTRAYGDFWSYMLVAEGSVDIATEAELSLWDMAALAPIVTEAGGRFTGVNGTDGVGQGNALASNGLLHQAAVDALAAGA